MTDMIAARGIPVDVIPYIVGHLHDRMDLYNATLVNTAFYRVAIRVLYEELDSRLLSSTQDLVVHHPAQTLIRNPTLASYVRSVKENGTVHGAPQTRAQNVHMYSLQALRLCASLRSFSWVDDTYLPDEVLLSILNVLKELPLRELIIRTFKNLGDEVWDVLHQLTGLERVSIFCMEGPPRILRGWSETLAPTLTHLDLGRCSGVPPTLLLSVFSHLKSLTHLRIKGAHSPSLPYFIGALPSLRSLDTDYSETGNTRAVYTQLQMPALEALTLRTGSMDAAGPVGLWSCARTLLSGKENSLREFRLQSFSTLGETSIPRPFILFMAQAHGATLKRFLVGLTILTIDDVACLCDKFPSIEEVSCAIPFVDVKGIVVSGIQIHGLETLKKLQLIQKGVHDATAHAKNLRSIRLDRRLFSTAVLRSTLQRDKTSSMDAVFRTSLSKIRQDDLEPEYTAAQEDRFSVVEARAMMLRPKLRLRQITIGPYSFRGQWVYDKTAPESLHFDVRQVQLEDSRGEA